MILLENAGIAGIAGIAGMTAMATKRTSVLKVFPQKAAK
jgi:hypothetical protein